MAKVIELQSAQPHLYIDPEIYIGGGPELLKKSGRFILKPVNTQLSNKILYLGYNNITSYLVKPTEVMKYKVPEPHVDI